VNDQNRVRLETEAISLILANVRAGNWRWISSEAVDLEVAAGPLGSHREWVERLLRSASTSVPISDREVARARRLVEFGLRGMDAMHIACAEGGAADVLLTTDDRFMRTAHRLSTELAVAVRDPVSWLDEVTAL